MLKEKKNISFYGFLQEKVPMCNFFKKIVDITKFKRSIGGCNPTFKVDPNWFCY